MKQAPFLIQDFRGGINDKLLPVNLPDNQCQDCVNFVIANGSLVRRPAFKQVKDATPAAITLPAGYSAFRVHKIVLNNQMYILTEAIGENDRKIFYQTAPDIQPIDLGESWLKTEPLSIAVYQNKCWIANGVEPIKIWDGTTITALTDPVFLEHNARILLTQQSGGADITLWLINALDDPTLVYYSGLTDDDGNMITPDNYKAWEGINADNYLYIGKQDGGIIYGATIFQNEIIIFKDNGIWKISGSIDTAFRPIKLTNEFNNFGCVQPLTIKEYIGRLYFVATDGHAYSFSGGTFTRLTGSINFFKNEIANVKPTFGTRNLEVNETSFSGIENLTDIVKLSDRAIIAEDTSLQSSIEDDTQPIATIGMEDRGRYEWVAQIAIRESGTTEAYYYNLFKIHETLKSGTESQKWAGVTVGYYYWKKCILGAYPDTWNKPNIYGWRLVNDRLKNATYSEETAHSSPSWDSVIKGAWDIADARTYDINNPDKFNYSRTFPEWANKTIEIGYRWQRVDKSTGSPKTSSDTQWLNGTITLGSAATESEITIKVDGWADFGRDGSKKNNFGTDDGMVLKINKVTGGIAYKASGDFTTAEFTGEANKKYLALSSFSFPEDKDTKADIILQKYDSVNLVWNDLQSWLGIINERWSEDITSLISANDKFRFHIILYSDSTHENTSAFFYLRVSIISSTASTNYRDFITNVFFNRNFYITRRYLSGGSSYHKDWLVIDRNNAIIKGSFNTADIDIIGDFFIDGDTLYLWLASGLYYLSDTKETQDEGIGDIQSYWKSKEFNFNSPNDKIAREIIIECEGTFTGDLKIEGQICGNFSANTGKRKEKFIPPVMTKSAFYYELEFTGSDNIIYLIAPRYIEKVFRGNYG